MDGPRDYHTKPERERQISLTSGIWNTTQMKYIWNKNRRTDIENRLVVAKVGRVEGKTGSLELADANYSI